VPLRQLRRVRWAIRASLALGVAASVAANILHAEQNPIAQTIAAWPPLALLLAIELISRVPVHRRSLAGVRLFATGAIAGIAAWVSYWHMAGVAARYGESGAAPYLLPLSVDGLVVVASVSLVELAGRIREAEAERAAAAAQVADGAVVVHADRPEPVSAPAAPAPSARLVEAKPVSLRSGGGASPIGSTFAERLAAGRARSSGNGSRPAPPRRGRPVEETRRLAAELAEQYPDATHEDLAQQLGITTKRLKTVLASTAA
jgi:hypothetical protein